MHNTIKKGNTLLAFCLSLILLFLSLLGSMPVVASADQSVSEAVYGESTISTVSLVSANTDHLGKRIILKFDKEMADPEGKEDEFSVTVEGVTKDIDSVALGSDNTKIFINMSNKIAYSSTPSEIFLTYTKGSVLAADGTELKSFVDQEVSNNIVYLKLVDYEPSATEIEFQDNGTDGKVVRYRLDELMDYNNVELVIYFPNGFFRNLEVNLKDYVKFYEKDTGEAVELPNIVTMGIQDNGSLSRVPYTGTDERYIGTDQRYMEVTDWYFWQIQGRAPLGLDLESTDLKPSTTYVVEVLKGFSFHTGPISDTYSFEFTTTPDTEAPYYPAESSLSVSDVGDSSLRLEWTAAEDNVGVERYNIYQNNSLLTTVDGETTLYDVAGLSAETEYSFKVEAVDSENNCSSDCLEVSVTTLAADEEDGYTEIEIIGDIAIGTNGEGKRLALTENAPSEVSISVPKEVEDVTINLDQIINTSSEGITSEPLPKLDMMINTVINTKPIEVNIEQGTIINASSDWNGVINLPTVEANSSVVVTPDANKTAEISRVIEIGAGDTMLQFSKAVRILIPDEAGKEVGFVYNGAFTKISTELAEDSQLAGDLLPEGGAGKIDVGNDLVIWTKHFTHFVTYTQSLAEEEDDGEDGDSTDESNVGSGANLRESKMLDEFKPEATLIDDSGSVLRYRYDELVEYDDVEFEWCFTYGFFSTFESNLEKYVKFYNKKTGKEVNLPNRVTQPISVDNYYMEITDWWFKRISGRAPLGLTLESTTLEPDTTYVIKFKAGFEFNNGNKTDKTYIFEFTTTEEDTSNSYELENSPKVFTVEKEGGTVDEEGVSIAIPSGAFKKSIEIEIQKVSDPEDFSIPIDSKLLSDIMEITKDKAGDFSKPVVITLHYDPSTLNSEDYDIGIYWYDEEESVWAKLDNVEVDMEKEQVSGEVLHFTKFAVIAKLKQDVVSSTEFKLLDITGHWAEDMIKQVVTFGIMNGYPDQTFKPDQSITRAEFATALVKALELEKKEGKYFADTLGHWAKDSISTAASYGLIVGYEEDRFAPDELITREQMAVMISRAQNMTTVQDEESFNDWEQISPWAKNSVAWAIESNIMSGYPDNTFCPKAFATRAEAAAIISKLL